jgi:hypothetical protein
LTYNGIGSILSAASWTKASQPVFQATSEVTGTGHASFTKSPDGHEDWIAYHAHANPTSFNEDRVIRIQPYTFNTDGTPNFGQPVPPGRSLAVPSSGPDPERPTLATDYQADGNVNNLDYNLWRATFGAAVIPGVAADGNVNGTADAADFVTWRKAAATVSQPGSSGSFVQSGANTLSSLGENVVVAKRTLVDAGPVTATFGCIGTPDDGHLSKVSGGARPAGQAPPLNSAAPVLWVSSIADRRTHSLDEDDRSFNAVHSDRSKAMETEAASLDALDSAFSSLIV